MGDYADFASYLRLSAHRKEEDGKDTFSFTIVDGKLDGKDAGKGNAFEAILAWLEEDKDCPLPQCEAFQRILNTTRRYEYRQCRMGGSNYSGRILCEGHAWQQIKQERE